MMSGVLKGSKQTGPPTSRKNSSRHPQTTEVQGLGFRVSRIRQLNPKLKALGMPFRNINWSGITDHVAGFLLPGNLSAFVLFIQRAAGFRVRT